MNAIHTRTFLQTATFAQTTAAANPLANVLRRLREAVGGLSTVSERRTAIADDKRRRRALRGYQRNQSILADGGFRFDPQQDDLFSRNDA